MKQLFFNSIADLAGMAAQLTSDELRASVQEKGHAVWGAAGGTSPTATYLSLASMYKDKLPWQQIKIFIGDERFVSIEAVESNWRQLHKTLLKHVPVKESNMIVPYVGGAVEEAAGQLDAALRHFEQIDLLWLGIGDDGHTLSLFPGHPLMLEDTKLGAAIIDSPKSPPKRITMTLPALRKVKKCLVFATGSSKADAVAKAFQFNELLPITRAILEIEKSGGEVTWLLDKAAASSVR